MKNVLIYDVAAEKTGAAAVLRKYYEMYSADDAVNSFFVTSVMDFPENEHTKVIKLPWTKNSRLHRLYCDNIYVKKLIREYGIDAVINLQNVAIKGLRVPQTVYLHNAIPISDVEFDFRQERSLWIFKHVISKLIVGNLKYADYIVVQAEWIREELIHRLGIDNDKILVERFIPTMTGESSRIEEGRNIFFYPANLCSYKNHDCILRACEAMKNEGITDYEVVFTLSSEEGQAQRELYDQVQTKKLPIKFVGLLSSDSMCAMYRKSMLLFPSYLETVGLPLIEAQYYQAQIASVDLPYAREAVGDYENVFWFESDDATGLKECMKAMMEY